MSYFKEYFSPITPSDFIKEWSPHPTDPTKIIGTWAEDGAEYEIIVPYQLRNIIITLQQILPDIINTIEKKE